VSDQQAFDFAAPTTRRTDPPTSHGAAIIAMHGARTHRAEALSALWRAGESGLTDFELAAIVGTKQTSVGKRRHELMSLGLVAPLVVECAPDKRAPLGVRPVTRPSDTGSPAQVWVITAAGVAYFEQHGLGVAS